MKTVAFKHLEGQIDASITSPKVTPGMNKDGKVMNYHVISCPDDVNLSDLQWFNASIILREDNPSGIVVKYSDLRPGHFVRMKKKDGLIDEIGYCLCGEFIGWIGVIEVMSVRRLLYCPKLIIAHVVIQLLLFLFFRPPWILPALGSPCMLSPVY